jgi:hypothetical protein
MYRQACGKKSSCQRPNAPLQIKESMTADMKLHVFIPKNTGNKFSHLLRLRNVWVEHPDVVLLGQPNKRGAKMPWQHTTSQEKQ